MSEQRMFPAGRYWIGDPCYATITGLMWQHHTAYGDGIYHDQKGREYGVDSGQLSITLVKNIDYKLTGSRKLAHTTLFKEPFYVSYENGTFRFGDIEIITGD